MLAEVQQLFKQLAQYRDIIERELTGIVERADDSVIGPARMRDKTVFDRRAE